MRTLSLVSVLAVSLVVFGAYPVQAAEHDFCVNPVTDAGGEWRGAGQLAGMNCNGEMLLNADNNDWYYVNVPGTQTASSTMTVTLCPTTAKTGPWNADIELYFLKLGQVLEQQGTLLFIPYHLSFGTNPGDLVDSSNNAAGCDQVSATAPAPAALGKWYVNVIRASGDGFYNLQTVLA